MKPKRIVFTGGPGGGKTSAVDVIRRELGDELVVVAEAATMLFLGGFPRSSDPGAKRSLQTAIFHVQRNLEDAQSSLYPDRILLCDRGTVDGGAYWPDGADKYFQILGTTLKGELARYDAVVFLESAAVGGISIEGGNRTRAETLPEAVSLNARLRQLWAQHPRFYPIAHEVSFLTKMDRALHTMRELLKG